jgi:hypothetical protein
MKKLWLGIVALCLFSSVAGAQQEPSTKKRGRWASFGRMLTCRHEVVDRKFCVATGLIGAAMIADAKTHFSVARRCPIGCEESNPVLGKHPSTGRVVGFGSLLFGAEVSLMYVAKKHAGEGVWLTIPAIAVPLHTAAAWRNSTLPADPPWLRESVCPANGTGCRRP